MPLRLWCSSALEDAIRVSSAVYRKVNVVPFGHVVGPSRWVCRHSSSNSRWKSRQGRDMYAREAKVQGLKSRAAFKLLELDSKYHLFKKGQVVVDLGYAPGSWSQVAVERTKPSGTVIGIDLIPAQPPRGVSTIQGNFLLPQVQNLVKEYLVDNHRRHLLQRRNGREVDDNGHGGTQCGDLETGSKENVVEDKPSYVDIKKAAIPPCPANVAEASDVFKESEAANGRFVNIVLSDMSAPWDQTAGFGVNTLSNPYDRMMNTSGIGLRDHAGSMDLCNAALQFASDTLKKGGHFVCKFYQGSEDRDLEKRLRQLFDKVHREKPESSRKDSKEAFFVALHRKADVCIEDGVD